MAALPASITIGELARRSGIAVSALRFYEARGLIHADRTAGNQRRFARATLRRVAIVRAAQAVGLSLDEIARAFDGLPPERAPSAREWERLVRGWRLRLDAQMQLLERLRDGLSDCIGCGCLSLEHCGLMNFGDRAAAQGSGARYLPGTDVERATGPRATSRTRSL